MKLKEFDEVRRWLDRDYMDEALFYTNLLKEAEESGKQALSLAIPKGCYIDVMIAIRMLVEIQYYDPQFINNVDFKIKE